MFLYHGSNCDIQKIDFEKCRLFKDFGQGFYLTTRMQQAKEMSDKVAMRFGGAPFINVFEIQDDFESHSDLLIKKFKNVDRDWAEFVMQNRNRDIPQPFHHYDIVVGPVANDDIATLFRTFASGIIDIKALMHGLEFKKLNDQYMFHTDKAISLLHKKESL